ncbi:unnamed protein product [Boreogadus saida]
MLNTPEPLKRTMGSQREQDLSSDQTGLSSSTRLVHRDLVHSPPPPTTVLSPIETCSTVPVPPPTSDPAET